MLSSHHQFHPVPCYNPNQPRVNMIVLVNEFLNAGCSASKRVVVSNLVYVVLYVRYTSMSHASMHDKAMHQCVFHGVPKERIRTYDRGMSPA